MIFLGLIAAYYALGYSKNTIYISKGGGDDMTQNINIAFIEM